jgi:hypothetical protein
MRELTANEKEIIENHKKWRDGKEDGIRANLRGANLRGANLRGVNLSHADLSYADLSHADSSYADLSHADLSYADLSHADLSHANLRGASSGGANLSHADLSYANPHGANLSGANLYGANLDFAAWPLWCGSLEAVGDEALCAQLAYHLARLMQNSGVSLDIRIKELANKAKQIKKHNLKLIE